ncbi:MAG: tetratricopeptide repeat protein [Sphingomonadales bacterium]|nr:tetratricopeptide repeat protein [Sphingomonadales bacterium]
MFRRASQRSRRTISRPPGSVRPGTGQRSARRQYKPSCRYGQGGPWRLEGARRFFEKATKIDPNMTNAWRGLGVSYAKTGDKPKAEAALAALQAKATACATTCPTAAELQSAIDAISAAIGGGPHGQLCGQGKACCSPARTNAMRSTSMQSA